ncbi:MAG: hypothetical protein AAFQ51_10545 [Pseudomonadota bacterium]
MPDTSFVVSLLIVTAVTVVIVVAIRSARRSLIRPMVEQIIADIEMQIGRALSDRERHQTKKEVEHLTAMMLGALARPESGYRKLDRIQTAAHRLAARFQHEGYRP